MTILAFMDLNRWAGHQELGLKDLGGASEISWISGRFFDEAVDRSLLRLKGAVLLSPETIILDADVSAIWHIESALNTRCIKKLIERRVYLSTLCDWISNYFKITKRLFLSVKILLIYILLSLYFISNIFIRFYL